MVRLWKGSAPSSVGERLTMAAFTARWRCSGRCPSKRSDTTTTLKWLSSSARPCDSFSTSKCSGANSSATASSTNACIGPRYADAASHRRDIDDEEEDDGELESISEPPGLPHCAAAFFAPHAERKDEGGIGGGRVDDEGEEEEDEEDSDDAADTCEEREEPAEEETDDDDDDAAILESSALELRSLPAASAQRSHR